MKSAAPIRQAMGRTCGVQMLADNHHLHVVVVDAVDVGRRQKREAARILVASCVSPEQQHDEVSC